MSLWYGYSVMDWQTHNAFIDTFEHDFLLDLALDIAVSGERALKVIELALAASVKRIGVNQKGAH